MTTGPKDPRGCVGFALHDTIVIAQWFDST
jgi:hypothetical protein